MSRLEARRPKTAFVLSGGSSLGAIQVGMLQALMEAGVKPDLMIGTSVGAVNAAWLAGRPDVDGALQLAAIWSGLRRQDIFPINPWAGALGIFGRTNHVISNAGLRAVLEKNLPYKRLEDAMVPVHVVTTDLKTGKAVVVLPIGYPWVRIQPSNALGMALHALARLVEQRLEAEAHAYRSWADIVVLPTIDAVAVSPADFSRTQDLIRLAYRSARKHLAATAARPPAVKPAALKLVAMAQVAASAA